jgi:uncharacterized membrane protein (UPF0127 family)
VLKPSVFAALTALTVVAGCATPPAVTSGPEAAPTQRRLSPPARPAHLLRAHQGERMTHCVDLDLEVIDLAADFDSPPVRKVLRAEVPVTAAEQQRGMQHRTWIAPNAAMLFVFDGEQQPAMWMKDTPSSLDIVFFDAAGQAIYSELGTEPNSEVFLTPLDPEPIATHVLELKAGAATRLGIMPGLASMTLGQIQPC